MPRWSFNTRTSPIGIDLGSQCVKLVQFSAGRDELVDAVRWDLPAANPKAKEKSLPVTDEARTEALAEALTKARQNRKFRGRDAVICLGRSELFLQNLRVPKSAESELERLVQQEIAGRLPYSVAEAEIRFLEAGDVRQGDATLREVIVLACHRPALERVLATIEKAGLNPVAIDVEPCAIIRSYTRQYRRDEDRQKRSLLVHVGSSGTAVVIAQGEEALLVKYLDLGGKDMDQAVADSLKMELSEAIALRRHNGDRRTDQQDPEVAQSIAEATRPVVERLISELSLCIRYHSVTFRGQPLARMVLGGGEATETLRDVLAHRLDLKCDLFDPLRNFANQARSLRHGQWDVAAGLALREVGGRK